ncbi:hypothetical protein JOM56_004213, partial [Amanita muscaria]
YPRSEDEEVKMKNAWLKGHTDFGTITILYKGQWKWVKHVPNALVINAGNAMEFLSGGFYRATIHRVIQPPPDQRSYTRLGVFYFDDNVKLVPFTQSPVLQSVGINKRFDDSRKGRTSAYGQSELKVASSATNVEEEYKHSPFHQGVSVVSYQMSLKSSSISSLNKVRVVSVTSSAPD